MRSVFILLLTLLSLWSAGSDVDGPGRKAQYLFSNELNSNPLTGRRYNVIIKVSTLQFLFSEAPFSIEIFGKERFSHQFQVGIIFPLEDDSFLQDLFRTSGTNSTASGNGIFSYRNSPYNNHGMSFKYEVRKYRENYYYAPQAIYKYCGYEDAVFPIFNNGQVRSIKESKFSQVLGLGIMAGRQTYFIGQSMDWYAGIGIRARHMSIKIHDSDYLKTQAGDELTASEEKFNVYPFLNFGFRIGVVLW